MAEPCVRAQSDRAEWVKPLQEGDLALQHPVPTTVDVDQEGIVRTCKVRGAIEAWNCVDVVKQIDPFATTRTLIDLAGVRELDSTGLGALIDLHQQVNTRGGKLAFMHPSPAVRRLLQTTRLLNYFTILEDPESIAQFKDEPVAGPDPSG